jgi:phosphatidylinositol-3-phosphatase
MLIKTWIRISANCKRRPVLTFVETTKDSRSCSLFMRGKIHYVAIAIILLASLSSQAQAQDRLCDTAFEDCRIPLWSLIDNETVGIDIAYWFMQDTSISNKIIARHQAGVPVRILVDPRANPTYAGNEQILNQLKAAGIPMRYKSGGGILHWKMMLFVGQNKLEFTGANFSANFFVPTTPNSNYIDEAIYFTDDVSLIQSFKTKYDDHWTDPVNYADYGNITGPLTRKYPTFPINAELNFPPSIGDSQDFYNRTQQNFNQETQKIDIIMYRITNQRYTDTTIEAVNRGIPVRLIHEPDEYRNPARQWDSWNVDRMYMAGVQVKMRKHLGLNHQKSVILYGKGMTIFGSSNWTGPSSNSQEEHNYFTTKPFFFNWFVDQFERKWNSTTENQPFVPLGPDDPSYQLPANGAVAQPTTIQLRWEGGRWAHKYDIYFGTSSNPPLLISNASTDQSGAGPGQPRLDTGSVDDGVVETFTLPITLTPGTQYFWRIVGKTMADVTASGPTWSFTTTGSGAPPSAPTGLTASAISPTRIDLSWTDTSSETGYRVERSSNGSTGWTEISAPGANQTSFSDFTVSAQQTCFYRVRAANSSGFSPYSNLASATTPSAPPPAAGDVVLWAGEAPVKVGAWSTVADASAAGGSRIANPDAGAPKRATALASPSDYFEMTFNAQAGVDYRLWIRGKALNDFWGNDSVFIQFSDSVNSSGSPVFRIGTTAATEMNLEDCSGCGVQGWGWQDNGWGIGVFGPLIRFQNSGTHTLRIQVREDGLSIDQIVLSAQTYLNSAPGPLKNDSTILPKSSGGSPPPPPPPAPTVSTVTPNSGSTVGGTSITIAGSGFQANATVSIGGSLASSVTVANSSTITALTPAHTAGTVDVVVTNTDAQSGTKAGGFTYVAPQAGMPLFDRVFVVVTENQSYNNVIGSSSMPYLNKLAQRYGLAINYFANTQPSIGDYFWLTTGQNITNDSNFTGTVSADNIVRQLNFAGKTWKAYAQSLPSVGYIDGDAYPYVKRHNPFAYFTDVRDNPSQANNLVPFSQFAGDMANNQLPNYSFIIPDQQNNAHDCPASIPNCTNADKLAAADSWLKTNIDPLISSAAFRQGGLLILTWDESVDGDTQNGGGHVATVVISAKAKQNFQAATVYQHQSTLRTMAEGLGLTSYPGAAATAPNMSEFFGATPNTAPDPNVVSPSSGPVAGGTAVTISGSGFAAGASVSFGGTSAPATVAGSTTINSVAPAHASGAVNIVVTNPGGQSGTLTNGFVYASAAPPSVSGITPNSGSTAGGTSVTINGSNFVSGATLSIGGTAASNVSFVNSTTLTATTPAHAAGTVNVVVTNPDAQSGTLTNGFTFTSPPGGETILLADDFNDASINAGKWIANNLFSGFTDATVALQETQAFNVGPLKQNVDGSHYNGIKSAGAHNFVGGYAYVQLVQGPSTSTAADAFFTLGLNVDNCYRMYVEAGNLIVQSKLGGAKQTLLTIAYNPTNHAFWRIRHDAVSGQVVFEVAPASAGAPGTWVQLQAQLWNTSAVPLSSVMFELKGGTWRIEGNNPGTVIFDNFKAARP